MRPSVKVVVQHLEKLPDGTIGLGNIYEMDKEAAIRAVRLRTHKAESAPIGVVPSEWIRKQKRSGVEEE